MQPQFAIGQMQHLPTHALGLTLVGISILAGYGFGLKPWQDSEQSLNQTRSENLQLQANAATVAAQILQISSDIRAKQADLAQQHCIPTDPNQPLIELVSQMLAEHALTLSSLQEDNSPATGSTTLSLQISGTYLDLLQLLSDLRQLERPTRIKALTLTPTDHSAASCSAKLNVGFAPANALQTIAHETADNTRNTD